MEFKLLGSLEISAAGEEVRLPAARKPRALLAVLLLHAGEALSADRLIDYLWDSEPPATARKVLQTYVLQLRRVLGSGLLLTEPAGYRLAVHKSDVDAHAFEELVVSTRPADGALAVSERLRAAASLWRGAPLADFVGEPFASAEIARLERLRLSALEQRIDADLSLGRHAELLGELESLVAEQPFAEKFRGQLMVALYRCGRQADALSVYRRGRELLIDELGIEPSLPLRELERAVLDQDVTLESPRSAQAVPATGQSPQQAGNRFVGRLLELDAVMQLIQASSIRLVTLTGPGGAGKTRLALSTIDRLARTPTIGTPVFVDLAPVADPDAVVGAIGRAVGMRQIGIDVDAAALAEFLRHRRLLLVLDNFERVIRAGPLISGLLAATTAVKVMVTSRIALEVVGEHVFAVPPLALPTTDETIAALAEVEAVALFMDRAKTIRPEFQLTEGNASSVASLCVRLGGLPLALELAAARIGLLSPRAMLGRIARSLDLLKTRSTAIPERHRTLRATIGWSYDLLAPVEQEFFDDLAVFRGGFTVEHAEAVATQTDLDAVDAVDSLLRANLIHAVGDPGDEPRFQMLETIREYAAEGLSRRGRTGVVGARHAMTFQRLAEYAEPLLRGPDQTRCLQLLDADIDNIRAALRWAELEGEVDLGLRTASALWRFWQIRGYLDEARSRLERLLDTGSGSVAARAAGQLTVAECAFLQGDMPTLQKFSAACIPAFRELRDDHALGHALIVLGAATARSGNVEHGINLLEEALSIARRADDDWLEMQALLYTGMVSTVDGNLTEAHHALSESLRGAKEIGDARSLAAVLLNLGNRALAGGDPDGARGWFGQALAVQRRLGDTFTIASLHGLAAAHLEVGDPVTARKFIDESLTIARDAHDRPGIAAGLEILARLSTLEGQPERAAQLYGAASVLGRALNHRTGLIDDQNAEVNGLQKSLGRERLADLWAAGRAQTLDAALAFALSTNASAQPRDRDGPPLPSG